MDGLILGTLCERPPIHPMSSTRSPAALIDSICCRARHAAYANSPFAPFSRSWFACRNLVLINILVQVDIKKMKYLWAFSWLFHSLMVVGDDRR
jgi:hypothetical protein